jgi:3-isopropylmalate/(R)-2-methylmalate dehydratase small subunit
MDPFTQVTGPMAPLMQANIDTDQIVPTEFLKRVERTGFGQFLFFDWAHDVEGELDPDFVLNRPDYRNAIALVTGPNFGSGSSREHAPWALQDWGFRVIIAPSFADIFLTNCYKIGLLPIELSERQTRRLAGLAQLDPEAEITVDLKSQTVSAPGLLANFEIDPTARRSLLGGLDEIDITLTNERSIATHESHRPHYKPSFGIARTMTTIGEPHD